MSRALEPLREVAWLVMTSDGLFLEMLGTLLFEETAGLGSGLSFARDYDRATSESERRSSTVWTGP
jgi:hypothetical protein